MNKTVILVNDDNHGLIGVAETYKAAIDCLLEWSGGELGRYDENNNFVILSEDEIKEVYTYGISKFNEVFDMNFYLDVDILWQS